MKRVATRRTTTKRAMSRKKKTRRKWTMKTERVEETVEGVIVDVLIVVTERREMDNLNRKRKWMGMQAREARLIRKMKHSEKMTMTMKKKRMIVRHVGAPMETEVWMKMSTREALMLMKRRRHGM
jgi:hypothetical protein